MKSKVWSYAGIAIGIACFVLGFLAFLVAAINGKTGNLSAVAATCNILTIVGLVAGIVSVFCCSQRTEWKVNMVQGFSSLAKIGLMLCIIVLFAVLKNT